MADEQHQNDDEMIIVREDYGFKANIRTSIKDIIRRIEFLERLNIMWAVTVARLLLFVFSFAGVVMLDFWYITNDGTRAKFVAFPIILLSIAVLGIITRLSLIDPSNGSLLKSSMQLLMQQFKRFMVANGFSKKPRRTGIHKIEQAKSTTSSVSSIGGGDEGSDVLFANGDYGKIYIIDGMTSATAYPSEIKAQEDVAMAYHNGRMISTTEIHLTSSQKQNTDQQIEHLESLYRSTTDKATKSMIARQHLYLKKHVNGEKPTIIQYLILRDASRENLEESIERLINFVFNKNYYYSIAELNVDDAKRVLRDLYALR